jgi:TRAP-type C4-dicarboxylate transport system substrate-binding protein
MSATFIPAKAMFALAGLATLTTCGNDAGADRLGGQGESQPVTLVFANPNFDRPAQMQVFADEVSDRTGGTVTIGFRDAWRQGEVDYESRTVADVEAGEVDLAWVGARIFDELGVNSFQALLAPMLIDSHDLQAAVFAAGIPADMLAGLEPLDVVGLGVLPGPLRKLVGIDHAFVSPDDFTGQVVGVQASVVADQTFAALGATTIDKPSGAALDGVDAYEQQFHSIAGNQYWEVADYVTTNVNLWPRPLVTFINAETLKALSEEQQQALRDAAAAVAPGAIEASRAEDGNGAATICNSDMTMVTVSDDELTALRAAVEPVYDELRSDATTAGLLDEIEALKAEVGAPPDGAACMEGDEAAGPSTLNPTSTNESALDGVYESVRGPGDSEECNLGPEEQTLRLEVGDGEYTLSFDGVPANVGQVEVVEDHVTFTEEISARWSFDGTTLTFNEIEGADGLPAACEVALVWGAQPWERVEAAATSDDQPTNTEPVESGALDGVYESIRGPGDSEEGCGIEFAEGSTLRLEVGGGEYTLFFDGVPGNAGQVAVVEDRVLFTGEISARWSLDGTTLTLNEIEGFEGHAADCDTVIVWGAQPWERVEAG